RRANRTTRTGPASDLACRSRGGWSMRRPAGSGSKTVQMDEGRRWSSCCRPASRLRLNTTCRWPLRAVREGCVVVMAQEKSRVLGVDDEPQITRVLRTVLSSQGYQVRVAAEGEAALTDFAEFRPELVITDLYMPHMDGIELCRRIRAMSAVPIIVLSV